MNENEPTRIKAKAPADLLKDLTDGGIPEPDPSHVELLMELYAADPDVRDVVAMIRNPTERRLAIERLRNLSREQQHKAQEIQNQLELRAIRAQVEATSRTMAEALRLQQERCDRVMRGEIVGCRPLLEIRHENETRIAMVKEELNRNIAVLSQKVAAISAIVGIVSAAIGGVIVGVFNWLMGKGG